MHNALTPKAYCTMHHAPCTFFQIVDLTAKVHELEISKGCTMYQVQSREPGVHRVSGVCFTPFHFFFTPPHLCTLASFAGISFSPAVHASLMQAKLPVCEAAATPFHFCITKKKSEMHLRCKGVVVMLRKREAVWGCTSFQS